MLGWRCWGEEAFHVSRFARNIGRSQTLRFESKGCVSSRDGLEDSEPHQAGCIRNTPSGQQGLDLILIRQEHWAA